MVLYFLRVYVKFDICLFSNQKIYQIVRKYVFSNKKRDRGKTILRERERERDKDRKIERERETERKRERERERE